MIYLKKANRLMLFLVTIVCVLTIFNTFTVMRLTRMVEAFEPVEIEYVRQVEPPVPETEATESTESTETVETTEPVTEPVEFLMKIDCPLDDETQQMIYQKCEEFGIDFSFAMAVIFKESTFRPDVVSYNGTSYGLMQIHKINHEWLSEELGITDFFDPEQNVTAGLYMLRDLFDKYETPRLVLMAYNMGESGARNLWKQGVYTSGYAEDVLWQAEIYQKQIEERMG